MKERSSRQVTSLMSRMKTDSKKTLVILTGPTAVGKTDLSIEIAKNLNTPVISFDARQFYKELKIGVATPSDEQLRAVKHYFIGHLSVADYYNVSMFEKQALNVMDKIFESSDYAIATGGSGLYMDVLCYGIDDLPDVSESIRKDVLDFYEENGIEGLRFKLKNIDPEYYYEADIANPKRMMRAIETYLSTGLRYSELRKKQQKQRDFKIKKVILNRERTELFSRINLRVDKMIEEGLVEEALDMIKFRNYNALNTVGYKEIYSWIDNTYSLADAIEKIKTNSRRYAKRQITWFKKYNDAKWFHPDNYNEIINFIKD
ncbi:MAG: tRNA (adenosine(37)-N6)-dimethylallyltransferase MiaA [Bacteroidales bacterium]